MLTSLLIRLFVRDHRNFSDPVVRLRYGVLSGAVGIAVNALLAAVKGAAAWISGSVALGADAVNNLSDAGGAVVTLIGFHISSKPADNEHPFGHGRVEYIAALVVAVLIISAGLNFLKGSIERIISPAEIANDFRIIIVVGATLLFKIWLFFFYFSVGRKIGSPAIKAQGFDALSDLVTTTIVLISLILSRYTAFPLDGVAGAIVALLTIYGAITILREAVEPLLGALPDAELVEKLRRCLLAQPGICGVHDIIMHNYGPGLYFATAHAECDLKCDLLAMHDLLEAAEVAVAREMPIRLTLHCDPFDDDSATTKMWRVRLEMATAAFDPVFKVYDFRFDAAKKILSFHLLMPRMYGVTQEKIAGELTCRMKKFDPQLALEIKFVHGFV